MNERLRFFGYLSKVQGIVFLCGQKKVKSLETGTDLWRIVRLFLLCGRLTSGCPHCSRPLWADGSGFVQFTLDNFPVFPVISLLAPLTPSTPAFVLRRLVDVAFDVAAAHCKGYIANVLWVAACVPTRWNKREFQRGNVMDKYKQIWGFTSHPWAKCSIFTSLAKYTSHWHYWDQKIGVENPLVLIHFGSCSYVFFFFF